MKDDIPISDISLLITPQLVFLIQLSFVVVVVVVVFVVVVATATFTFCLL